MISLVIPSYEASAILERQLPPLITYMNDRFDSYEIVIVDDGSKNREKTKEIAHRYQCRFIQNDQNLGKGGSVRKGVLSAKGEYIIFTDVDIPFRYDSIEMFHYYLSFKEFDVVIGDRSLKDSVYFEDISKWRRVGSAFFTFIIGRLVTTGLFDTQCGIKGFQRAIAQDLFGVSRIKGFAFDVELLYIALKRNYDIKRLPVVLRSTEGSSVSLLKHGFIMIKELLMIKWNHLTNKYKRIINE